MPSNEMLYSNPAERESLRKPMMIWSQRVQKACGAGKLPRMRLKSFLIHPHFEEEV